MFLSFSREINVRVELIFLLFDLLSLRKLLISLEANPIITPKMVEIIGIYPVIFNVKISSINNFLIIPKKSELNFSINLVRLLLIFGTIKYDLLLKLVYSELI